MLTLRFVYSDGFERIEQVRNNLKVSIITTMIERIPSLVAVEVLEHKP